MPWLKVETTVAVPEDKRNALLCALSKTVAEIIGKPEQYVMVAMSASTIQMAGRAGDAAFVDVRSIGGLTDAVNQHLAQKISAILKQSLGILPERIYLNFTDMEARNWAWNGDTFG